MAEEYYKRRTGRTTRLIDVAIQELFNNGSTKVNIHHDIPPDVWNREQNRAVKILCNRIKSEHPHTKIIVDRSQSFWTVRIMIE